MLGTPLLITAQARVTAHCGQPQIRRLLTVTLEANAYRVLAATTGQEGLVLAAQHRPAVVILDLGLPGLSGHEVLRRLRE